MIPIDKNLFLNPQLTTDTLDIFWAKHSILASINKSLPMFEGTLLDVGCGQQPYRELLMSPPSRISKYLGLDLDGDIYGGKNGPSPDLRWDGNVIPLEDNHIDTAFATEVLEHCPDPAAVFKEIYRVLMPGGRLFLTVPFLWPLHDAPHDYYRYTPFALARLLEQAGFKENRMDAMGGWDAALGQMIGLWISRRPISHGNATFIRRLLSILCLPVVRYLFKKDRAPESFMTNAMITGICCLAVK